MAAVYDDGASGAPAGTPLLANLLTGYAAPPPWSVAGVNYAVGVPADASMKDPATIALAGVSANSATHMITVTGSNVTLDGYDFGLSGGWGISINAGATNTVIQNSKFQVGSNNNVPINARTGAGNLTVQNNTIDGGGGQNSAIGALISYDGSGTFVAQYNALQNAPADAIDFSSGTMTTLVKYNAFNNLGTTSGSHPDSVQYVGVDSNNSVMAFNTIYEPNPSGMEGIQLAAQNGSTLTNSTIDNNVVVAKGPSIDMSYSIALQQIAGNTINGVGVGNNYIDYSGAYGAFYPPSGSNLTFTGNVNLSTGAQIPNPSGTSSGDTSSAPAAPAAPTVPTASVPASGVSSSSTGSNTTYNPGSAGGTITTLSADKVNVGSGAVTVNANGSSADVIGGAGALTFVGSSGSDTVHGGTGAVSITGNKDTLAFTAGSGDATISAGTGKEIYDIVNGQAGGNLTISDFVSGTDSVNLSGYHRGAIQNEQTMNGSTQITLSDNTHITLRGVTGLSNQEIFTGLHPVPTQNG